MYRIIADRDRTEEARVIVGDIIGEPCILSAARTIVNVWWGLCRTS